MSLTEETRDLHMDSQYDPETGFYNGESHNDQTDPHVLIQQIQPLTPLLMSIRSSEGRIPVSAGFPETAQRAIKFVGIGTAIAAAIVANQSEKASAHDDQTDTPQRVVIGQGESLYNELSKQGYTHKEIVRELERHGIGEDQAWDLKLTVGFGWEVAAETYAEMLTRTGADVLKIPLSEGETVWEVATGAGVKPADIPKVLEASGLTQDEAQNLQAGYEVKIPSQLIKVPEQENRIESFTLQEGETIVEVFARHGNNNIEDVKRTIEHMGWDVEDTKQLKPGQVVNIPPEVTLQGSVAEVSTVEPVVLQLNNPGDTIMRVLAEHGVTGIENVKKSLELSGLTPEDAEHMKVGETFLVRGDLLAATTPINEQPPTIVGIPEGSSIYEELNKRGVNKISTIKEVLTYNNLTLEEAMTLPADTEILVPPTITLIEPLVTETAQLTIIDSNRELEITENQIAVNDEATEDVHKENKLLLGDSLSHGMDVLGKVQEYAAEKGIGLQIHAESGASFSEIVDQVNPADLLAYSELIIALGTNAKENDEAYRAQIQSFIQSILDAGAQDPNHIPELTFVTLHEAGDKNVVREETRNSILYEIQAQFGQTYSAGIDVIDWHSFASERPDIYEGGDGIHPTDYKAMGVFVLDASMHDAVQAVPASQPAPVEEIVEQQPEAPLNPTQAAYKIIVHSVMTNNGVLTQQAASEANHWINQIVDRGPQGDSEFPYPDSFFTIYPNVQMPFVVHPRTCSTELFAQAGGIVTTMQSIAVLEYLLQQPEWAHHRAAIIELGDLVSGDHNTHDDGWRLDLRSRLIQSLASNIPDGPLFNMLSPNYDPEFNIAFFILMGLSRNPDGDYLLEQIEFEDDYVIDEVNKALRSLGRHEKLMAHVHGHNEHGHLDVTEFNYDGSYATPNTPSNPENCERRDLNADPALIAELESVRSLYELPNQEVPVIEAPAVEEQQPEFDFEAARAMSAEDYVAVYHGGVLETVTYYDGKTVEVSAEAQKWIHLIWVKKYGVSYEVFKEALTISGAESGFDNSAVNRKTGDRCFFQVNKVNREFVESLGYDYDTLHENPEACVEVAYALYSQSIGAQYTADKVHFWMDNWGLDLPEELYERAINGEISRGYMPWLMSARKTGLL